MRAVFTVVLCGILLAVGGRAAFGDGLRGPFGARHPGQGPPGNYVVTLQNLTTGQPLSPGAAATHGKDVVMFRVGALASPQIEAIAEDGNQAPMVDLLQGLDSITETVDISRPLTPSGATVGDFTDSFTFPIKAETRDRLSLAVMLICTNDGFTGLDRVRLPPFGSRIYLAQGYDAGTEDNTEKSIDIVDPCSALGPVELSGDPNGNEDAAVDTDPAVEIRHHPNVEGAGDLKVDGHAWKDPVLKVTVTVVDENAHVFAARLSGAGEVPPVSTHARGWAIFRLGRGEQALDYLLIVEGLKDVTQAHIHMGTAADNGPVVAFLFRAEEPLARANGLLARGSVTESDLIGPLEGDFEGFVARLRLGRLYANVHTGENPGGEIRGQVGALGLASR